MAEPLKTDRKSQLIAEIARSRVDLARNSGRVREELDVAEHFRHAFARQTTAWMTGAALAGWCVARLAMRKPSHSRTVEVSSSKKTKEAGRAGLLLTALSMALPLFKPVLVNYANAWVKKQGWSGNR